MAWFGPRGNCGCCTDANCRCPIPDCFCPDLRRIVAENVTISNIPAVIYSVSRNLTLGVTRTVQWSGFEVLNDVVFTARKSQGCLSLDFFKFVIQYTIYQSNSADPPTCSEDNFVTSGTYYCRLDYTQSFVGGGPWLVRNQTNISGDGWEDDSFTGLPVLGYDTNQFPFRDPLAYNICENAADTPITDTTSIFLLDQVGAFLRQFDFTSAFFDGCSSNMLTPITTNFWLDTADDGFATITGWRYIVSDIPQFVDVRAFGTTVYRVEGLDGFNGTYDVARREDLDCAAGIQRFQLNLTAEQYDITTSTPCLETPVPGGTKNVLATLTIPPSQFSKRILSLVIDGVGTFGYDLSEDWDSYACGPQTETLTESDPCLVHTGDWLTIESSALLE